VEQHAAHDVLAAYDLELGMIVGVDEESGLYRIVGVGRDGSLTVYSEAHRQFRSFLPEWCYRATRVGRGGRTVAGRLPADRRGLRRRWRVEHGYGGFDEANGTGPELHRLSDGTLDENGAGAG
jgi:hypothetical protein